MAKTDIGQGKQALLLAGGGVAGYRSAAATSTTATSLTDTAASGWIASTGTNFGTANVWTGYVVVAGTGTSTVYGVIVSNTTTVLNIDRWYNPTSPTGTAAATPTGTTPYTILAMQAPCLSMAITTGAVAVTDTALASEQTTNGLSRAFATYGHTYSNVSANNTYTYTLTYTYTGTGAVTLTAIGIFDSALSSTGIPLFTTALSSSATVSASGDTVTVTDTVTM